MSNRWTYQYADLPRDEWCIYTKELLDFWTANSNNHVPQKAQFFVVPFRSKVCEFELHCPTLYCTLKEKNILEFIVAVAFLVVPPNQKTDIHTDSGTQSIALNLPVLNCEKSYTVWYNTTDKLLPGNELAYVKGDSLLGEEQFNNYLDYDSDYFKFNTAEEIDRVECNRPLWINFKIPHRPEVAHTNVRILASIRFRPDFSIDIINENITTW